MSRIGKLPIVIPAGTTVDFKDGIVTVKGPKGQLSQKVDPSILLKFEDVLSSVCKGFCTISTCHIKGVEVIFVS